MDLGLSSIRILTNNPKKIRGLEGYGLSVSAQIPIEHPPNRHNEAYMRTKKDRMGHILHHQGLNLDAGDAARRARAGPRAVGGRGVSAPRYAIVVARFYEELADRLVAGAQATFAEAGADAADVFDVPGAFELPLAARMCAQTGRYAGVACLGAVIRGETDHYDYVCAEAARGIQDVQLQTGVPCAFGVLTVDTIDQALARSGGDTRDSGRHAAEAVLALGAIRAQLS